MRVGFGKCDITPPVGTKFGCFAVERLHPIVGHHDPLMARAFVASLGDRTVALVSCDLALITPSLVREARSIIHRRLGLLPHCVLISATHVHSAPGGTGSESALPGIDPDYFAEPEYTLLVRDGIAQAVESALADAEECIVYAGYHPITGIGTPRESGVPYQPHVGVLHFVKRAGNTKGIVVSYGCHPSILGFQNLLTSSDYVGVVCDVLSRSLGGSGAVLLMGPSGDISTRLRRREQTYLEVERLGNMLAQEILNLLPSLEEIEPSSIQSLSRNINLPLGPLPSLEELESEVRRRKDILEKTVRESPDRPSENPTYNMNCGLVMEQYTYYQRAVRNLETVRNIRVTHVPSEIQVIRIGPVYFLGLECELHSSRENEIRESTRSIPYLFIVAPANGSLGNIGGKTHRYGILGAYTGDTLVAEAIQLLEDVSRLPERNS